MTKAFIKLFIISTIFIFCEEKRPSNFNEFLNDEPEEIVAGISSENVLMGPSVGIGGTRPKQWDRYEALLSKVSDKDLIVYTNHLNPTVRCYSFEALVNRKNPEVNQILLKHLKDSEEVKTLFGCIAGSQTVVEYFLEKSKNILSSDQRQIIDSILIFDKTLVLNEKYSVLDLIKQEPKYYWRIKEMLVKENDFKVAPVLAKYKKQADVPIILDLLKNSDSYKQYYGFLSVINYPHPIFFPVLKQKILNKEIFKTEYNYQRNSIRRALYSAIVQFKNLSARSLLEKELQNAKGEDLINKTDLIYQALKQYPDSIFIGVIRFNFYK